MYSPLDLQVLGGQGCKGIHKSPWRSNPVSQSSHFLVNLLKTGQWGGTSKHVKLTRYWLAKHWGTLTTHLKFSRIYPWTQVVQFPVPMSNYPQSSETLKHILFWIHCLAPHFTSMKVQFPSINLISKLIQLRQAPVNLSKSRHVSLTGRQDPKWK